MVRARGECSPPVEIRQVGRPRYRLAGTNGGRFAGKAYSHGVKSIEASPQPYARTGGVLYLVIIALGIFGQMFVRDKIYVAGNPSATAANLISMESLWRMGIAAECVSLACVVALAMIYYYLLRPVSKELNLLATFFRMVSIAVEAAITVYLVSALLPVVNAKTKALNADQLGDLASLAIRTHSAGYALALFFTGCTFLVHGYLIMGSGYLPKTLGVLIEIAGIGYVVNTFAQFLFPSVAPMVFMAVILPVLIAETSLSLWLIFKGVNVEKWNERLAAA